MSDTISVNIKTKIDNNNFKINENILNLIEDDSQKNDYQIIEINNNKDFIPDDIVIFINLGAQKILSNVKDEKSWNLNNPSDLNSIVKWKFEHLKNEAKKECCFIDENKNQFRCYFHLKINGLNQKNIFVLKEKVEYYNPAEGGKQEFGYLIPDKNNESALYSNTKINLEDLKYLWQIIVLRKK